MPTYLDDLQHQADLFDARYERSKQRKQTETPHKKMLKACSAALKREFKTARIEIRNVARVTLQSGRQVTMGQKGEADLRVTIPTLPPIAVEIKCGYDKQSDWQSRWAEKWRKAGGMYFIVGDAREAISIDALVARLMMIREGGVAALTAG